MTTGLTTMINCNLTTLESKTVWIVDKKQWSRTVNGCQNELSCTRNSRCRYSRSIYTLGCTVTWSVRRACAPRIPNHSPLTLLVTSRKINVIGDKMFRLSSDPTSPIRNLSIGNYLKITYHNITEVRRYNLEITTCPQCTIDKNADYFYTTARQEREGLKSSRGGHVGDLAWILKLNSNLILGWILGELLKINNCWISLLNTKYKGKRQLSFISLNLLWKWRHVNFSTLLESLLESIMHRLKWNLQNWGVIGSDVLENKQLLALNCKAITLCLRH